jgi:hypothetical protein
MSITFVTYLMICAEMVIKIQPSLFLWLNDDNNVQFSITSTISIIYIIIIYTTDWTTMVRSWADAKDSSSSLCVQISSEPYPASCAMGAGGTFPGAKARPGRDADHSPQSSAKVENE